MLFIVEDKLKNSPAQYFVSSWIKKSFGSCRHCLQFVEVQSKLLSMEWIVSVVCQGHTLALSQSCSEACWSLLIFTCACRSLSAPAGGSSSWPCILPPSTSVPPQCRSFWAGVCTCSQGSAPDAACSASPALHSKAASPGLTCPSTWSLKTKTQENAQWRWVHSHGFSC